MDSTNNAEPIRLLHLSDLHQGLAGQEWMWPSVKTQFYEDLSSLRGRTGPWDLVIFSGDLTQSGTAAEFNQLTQLFCDLWAHFKTLGSSPQLFVVPGNHDLERPGKMDATGKVMSQWWEDDNLQAEFWGSSESAYRKAVAKWFANYEAWLELLPTSIPLLPTKKGLLPGDVSATFQKGSQRLGLVGLNTAWLHHTSGDLKGKICVHPRQLLAVTSNDADGWSAAHGSRLLVTHHPVNWLHPKAREDWASDINTPNRFDVHLFGHMHDGRFDTNSASGGSPRHSVQAASLFGLEHFGDKVQREHGYAVIQIPAVSESRGMRIWPRTVKPRADGSRRLVANQLWDLTDDSYCDIGFEVGTKVIIAPEVKSTDPLDISQGMEEVLTRLARPNSFNEAHGAVRRGEQSVFQAALKDQRRAWLVTSWGLGGDEFIEGVQRQILGRRGSIYYLDLHKYRTQEEVLEGLPQDIGCSFARLCSGLAEEGPVILVLDDLELDTGSSAGAIIGQQIHGLVQVILDFCPHLCVVVRSRAVPAGSTMKVVELKPLDEADTSTYVSAHPKGGAHLAKHDAVMRLHRHTDGVPSRIDATLRDLHIVGLKGVYELDSDVAGKDVESRDVSPALVRTIKDLSTSTNDLNTRSFALLKVLSMFPQGEQFARVRRFFGARAFHPPHASKLFDLALVDAVDVSTLGGPLTAHEQARALVVKRPVREYVIQSLSDAELRTLSAKALSLYFGDEWELKGIRPLGDLNFKDTRCDVREIVNACTMILRATTKAIEVGNPSKIRAVLALSTSFVAELRAGGHFRSIAALYDDLLPLHERAGIGQDLNLACLQHAHALRMIGEHLRARDLLKQCEASVKTKTMMQQRLVELALVSQALGAYSGEIVDIARRAEAIDRKTNLGLQAKGIAIANDEAHEVDRDHQLRLLQEEAVRRKAFIVSNNLAIERAASTDNVARKKQLLHEASNTARSKHDPYNLVRASLKLADLELSENGALSKEMLMDCTRAYSYLYNQRIDSLFSSSHSILWRAFQSIGEVENMLTLFRHSSLVWRLKGQDSVERKFIEQLLPLIGKKADAGAVNMDYKLLYFMTRNIQLASNAVPALPGTTPAKTKPDKDPS